VQSVEGAIAGTMNGGGVRLNSLWRSRLGVGMFSADIYRLSRYLILPHDIVNSAARVPSKCSRIRKPTRSLTRDHN